MFKVLQSLFEKLCFFKRLTIQFLKVAEIFLFGLDFIQLLLLVFDLFLLDETHEKIYLFLRLLKGINQLLS